MSRLAEVTTPEDDGVPGGRPSGTGGILTTVQGFPDGCEFEDAPVRLDRDAIWALPEHRCPWHRWRTRDVVEARIDSAWRVAGFYRGGSQVRFARAIADGVALTTKDPASPPRPGRPGAQRPPTRPGGQ